MRRLHRGFAAVVLLAGIVALTGSLEGQEAQEQGSGYPGGGLAVRGRRLDQLAPLDAWPTFRRRPSTGWAGPG